MKKLLFCVLGRTSAGKSEIAKRIAKKHGLKIVQSYTTRKPRPDEIENGLENSDHIFVSDQEFDQLNPIAPAMINGNRYCTTKEELMKSDLYIIEPCGVKDLKEKIGDQVQLVEFYVYADQKVREQRYTARGESKKSFNEREKKEQQLFTDYENNRCGIIIYNNEELDSAVEVMDEYVSAIIEGYAAVGNPSGDSNQDLVPVPAEEEDVAEAEMNDLPLANYSLVQIEQEEYGLVSGPWIQDCCACTMEEATRCARETEAANSNRIQIAVIDQITSVVPYQYVYKAIRLDSKIKDMDMSLTDRSTPDNTQGESQETKEVSSCADNDLIVYVD